MAHKKGMGSTRNGRDSKSKRLGVKRSDGQLVRPGGIILRQRGSRVLAGENVRRANDDTLFALVEGTVKFEVFRGSRKRASVIPAEAAAG